MVPGVIAGLVMLIGGGLLLFNYRGFAEGFRRSVLDFESRLPRWMRPGYRARNSPRVFYRIIGADVTLFGLLLVGISVFGSSSDLFTGRIWVEVAASLAILLMLIIIVVLSIATLAGELTGRGHHG